MFRLSLAFLLAASPALAVIETPKMTLVEERDRITKTSEARIQEDILDPVLGKDRASVFVDVDLELLAKRKENTRGGAGMAEKYKEKGGKGGGFATQFILPGVPKPKNIISPEKEKPEAAQGQMAQQIKSEEEESYVQQVVVKKFSATVIHDDRVSAEKLKEIRSLIVDAMSKYALKPENVLFKPTRFSLTEKKLLDDLKDPSVYLPLLFASLLLLLLMFLFGPFARFLRRYTEALAQKPAAEVNVESNIEAPEGKGKGADGKEESLLDIMLGHKPPEPVPASEEDEDMKKMEPFAYVNEENLKRLANLFLLRREEPWLIAVVLSYLKPEFARLVLTALPVELQAKVAMEALMVRQVSREQVAAIDAEIKESIDFVVGGIERLTQMLEEADTPTRVNILEYLKNEKPLVYERVRKSILIFEDIAGFPDKEMQTVVRELKTESMARALQGAAPEIVNKFFNNMSAGAASLLKESMEYTKELTPAQVEEERTKILDQIKALEKEGKISVRQGTDSEGFQEVLATEQKRSRYGAATPAEAPAPAADPAQAQQYLQAGLQSHEAGQLEQAVEYLRYAAQLDPSLAAAWQYLGADLYQLGRQAEALAAYERLLALQPDPQIQAWVDGFKSQAKT